VVSSTSRPHFTPGKDPIPIVEETGWAPGRVWKGEKSRPHRDSIPDRPALSSVAIPTELPAPPPHTHKYTYIYMCVCVCVCVSNYRYILLQLPSVQYYFNFNFRLTGFRSGSFPGLLVRRYCQTQGFHLCVKHTTIGPFCTRHASRFHCSYTHVTPKHLKSLQIFHALGHKFCFLHYLRSTK